MLLFRGVSSFFLVFKQPNSWVIHGHLAASRSEVEEDADEDLAKVFGPVEFWCFGGNETTSGNKI